MAGELRCRGLSDTLALAVAAATRAGVSRVSDVTAFAVPGVPVFQATRPTARSLTVSQGKGLTPTAAIVSALLESVELWSAEHLARPEATQPLADLAACDIAAWSGTDDPLAVALDPGLARAWLTGEDLLSGDARLVPWDLLSLDGTLDTLDGRPASIGLACGNTRTEALVSGLAETLEHHGKVLFERASPRERLSRQIGLATIDDPVICRLLRLVDAAGFRTRAWSMANDAGFPAILCTLFRRDVALDGMAPPGGSGCHPNAGVAFQRALLEAVQTLAGLMAGARDDLTQDDYAKGAEREAAIVFRTLAFADGPLAWRNVPTAGCTCSEQCLEFLLARVQELTSLPVVAFDHAPPCEGLHLAHVVAPGLLFTERQHAAANDRPAVAAPQPCRASLGRNRRKLLFAGPSIAGLDIPAGIELRPPARCGDLAALLDDPPTAVGLVDGVFRLAPTVWHKEIMGLLALGTRVIGGASLGALRAAELERFGMQGVGTIFHFYRSGLLMRDDAVMLVHAPDELGHVPLSLPLVDAEHALATAEIAPKARRVMQRIVRCASFTTRNWTDCYAEYRARTGEDFPLAIETLATAPSLKQSDAALVIEALRGIDPGDTTARRWPMPPLTDDFRELLARTAPAFAAAHS